MTKAIHFWDLILLFGSFDLQTVDPDTNVLAYSWKLQILYLIFFGQVSWWTPPISLLIAQVWEMMGEVTGNWME